MTARWLACPNCLTLAAPSENCPECGQPLTWIEQHAELRRALDERHARGWHPELHVTIADEDRQLTLVRRQPGPFEVSLGTQESVQCCWDEKSHRFQVKRDGDCSECVLPGKLIVGGLRLRVCVRAALDNPTNPGEINEFAPESVVVSDTLPVTLGAQKDVRIQLAAEGIAPRHCLIARGPTTTGSGTGIWVVDLGSESGTFVNRQQVLCRVLQGEDLVQVGPYAWTVAESQGTLVPVSPIEGVGLKLRNLRVGRRLGPVWQEIDAGQFVAIVGESGSGKSTLLKAILGAPGCRDLGTVYADGRDTRNDLAWFRSITGYLSQDCAIHADLAVGAGCPPG